MGNTHRYSSGGGQFTISCKDFKEGEEIPKNCGYKHGNKQPQIQLQLNPGNNAAAFAFIMDDPDAMEPAGKVWVHWVLCNWSPTKTEIDEGFRLQMYKILMAKKDIGIVEGRNDFHEIGYGGPAPPDKRHTYVFKLYKLSIDLDLPIESTKADVEKAMEGHIIEQTQLTGTYAP